MVFFTIPADGTHIVEQCHQREEKGRLEEKCKRIELIYYGKGIEIGS